MTIRQFAFCVLIGPVLAFFLIVGVIGLFPLLIVIGWLMGDQEPISGAWEIVTLPPIEMFKEGYQGPKYRRPDRGR